MEVSCELRLSESDCLDPALTPGPDQAECVWDASVLFAPTDACDAVEARPACLAMPFGGPGGCTEAPCPSRTVLYRLLVDGVEILPGDYCGIIPIEFSYCTWTGDELDDGPPACICGCGG